MNSHDLLSRGPNSSQPYPLSSLHPGSMFLLFGTPQSSLLVQGCENTERHWKLLLLLQMPSENSQAQEHQSQEGQLWSPLLRVGVARMHRARTRQAGYGEGVLTVCSWA